MKKHVFSVFIGFIVIFATIFLVVLFNYALYKDATLEPYLICFAFLTMFCYLILLFIEYIDVCRRLRAYEKEHHNPMIDGR